MLKLRFLNSLLNCDLQTYANLRVLKLQFLNSLLKSQLSTLCKSSCLKIAVLKFTVKTAIYKPMQVRNFLVS